MGISDIVKLIIDAIKAGYHAATNRPHVICDVLGVYKARWSPDFFPGENGNTVAEGIEINTKARIRLTNEGRVDTTLKDIHIIVRSGKAVLGQLPAYPSRSVDKFHDKSICGAVIKPRRMWGPEVIEFRGSFWNIYELPPDLEAELVVEVVAQRPIKKKIKLYF